ncbi:glutaredoxin [Novimethylophilus kurashikiensis]|uniref:Glutaredoxin n=1 Tax=Novimethylophilus kurashikiensis TaxID=1825523 RepID=A0A2R5FBT1_9PROT|nr:glutaredoxin family protein [Novimethylophilus kurashikiensis]GBG15289.1 glutaredoxin [Novimethylophilus kurashikiensis]
MTHLLTLYGTDSCHLCEEALSIIESCKECADLEIVSIDIAADDSLEMIYGLRIPVLKLEDKELNWPFDRQQCLDFLEHLKN